MTPADYRFRPGDRVRVKALDPPGHVRSPWYIRGKTGHVVRVHGAFRDPERLAYGGDGLPPRPLYLVGFRQTDIWPDYRASPRDTLYVDIYEHWLEPAQAEGASAWVAITTDTTAPTARRTIPAPTSATG